MPDAVVIDGLQKRYGPTVALAGVSLSAAPGEILGLLGQNGAGKTTTLECALGLRRPDAGRIVLNGIDAIADPVAAKRVVGAQLQAVALQDKITPRQALKFFARFYENPIPADRLIRQFDLTEKADANFQNLSTGQKQRLAVALAFVNDPKILFLDEPTAGLDPQSRRSLHAIIRQLKLDGRTVVLSTHHIEEASQLCDRIAVIHAGVVTATGTPGELLARAKMTAAVTVATEPTLAEADLRALPTVIRVHSNQNEYTLRCDDATACVIGLVRLIDQTRRRLVKLQIREPDLEDAFVELTRPTVQNLSENLWLL